MNSSPYNLFEWKHEISFRQRCATNQSMIWILKIRKEKRTMIHKNKNNTINSTNLRFEHQNMTQVNIQILYMHMENNQSKCWSSLTTKQVLQWFIDLTLAKTSSLTEFWEMKFSSMLWSFWSTWYASTYLWRFTKRHQ